MTMVRLALLLCMFAIAVQAMPDGVRRPIKSGENIDQLTRPVDQSSAAPEAVPATSNDDSKEMTGVPEECRGNSMIWCSWNAATKTCKCGNRG